MVAVRLALVDQLNEPKTTTGVVDPGRGPSPTSIK